MVIISKRVIWVRHVPCMGEMRNSYRILVGKLRGRGSSEDLSIDVKIILKWILQK